MSEQIGGVSWSSKDKTTKEDPEITTDSDPIDVLTHVNNLLNELLQSMKSNVDVKDDYFNNLKFDFKIETLLNTKFTPKKKPTDTTPNILRESYLKKLKTYLDDKENNNIFDKYKSLLLKYTEIEN